MLKAVREGDGAVLPRHPLLPKEAAPSMLSEAEEELLHLPPAYLQDVGNLDVLELDGAEIGQGAVLEVHDVVLVLGAQSTVDFEEDLLFAHCLDHGYFRE